MKHSIKGLFLILVIVMSFVAVQSVSAETIVEGSIASISTRPNVVVLDGSESYEVYGVMFNYLSKHHEINLTVNMDVKFRVFEYQCNDGTTKLKACEIAVDSGDWVFLRGCS